MRLGSRLGPKGEDRRNRRLGGGAKGLGETNSAGDSYEVSPAPVRGVPFWCHQEIEEERWAPFFLYLSKYALSLIHTVQR